MSTEQRLLAVSPNLPCAMDRQEWSLEDYHVCKTLYNGYAAQVYTATCRYSGMEVVLKVYHDVNKAPDVAQHEIYREVAIQSGLQHPNVVHLFGAFEEGDTLVLVQEYVPNGDLLALMQNHGGRVDEATVVRMVLRPLLGSLMYLHRWGIVHRDVKPENVLFAADGSIKLADFGLAINMVEERPISRVGTLDYMAPEVLRCPIKQSMAMTPAPGAPARYGFATDVWAVGIVTFELLTGLPPYASDCRYQAESRICSALPPLFPNSISPMARDFILRALAPIPGDRPTVRQLLEHPWIVNPDACLAPARAPQLSHAHSNPHPYPYCQPHQPQPQRSAFPLSQPAAPAAPLAGSPAASHGAPAAAAPVRPHPFPAGYSSSDLQQPSASRPTAAAAAVSAVSSPAALVHSRKPIVSQFSAAAAAAAVQAAGLPSQPHPESSVAAAADAAAALSVDQQLRALQQQQLLDLSKLPLDQIQGMIQKLQEAMQLAVVQHQQQQQVPEQQLARPAGSGASAVAAAIPDGQDNASCAAAYSRCSGGAGASAAPPAASSNSEAAAAVYGGGDVHMADALRDSADAAPELAAGAYAYVSRAPAAAGPSAAVPSAALSCSNSPQHQLRANPRAAAAAVQQPCRGSPNAVNLADAASYASTATGYGSLCASRRTTVDATPRAAAVFAVTSADSPTQVSFVRHSPTPRAVGADLTAAAMPRATEGGSPACRSPVQVPLVVASPTGAAAATAAVTPRPACSGDGGGSQGGALHEGDGLVYVSIGSSRKAAAMAQCDGNCLLAAVAAGDESREAFMAAWMRQFGAS